MTYIILKSQTFLLKQLFNLIRNNFKIISVFFYASLALIILFTDIHNPNKLNEFKETVLTSKITQATLFPTNTINKLIDTINSHIELYKKQKSENISEQNQTFALAQLQQENIELKKLLKFVTQKKLNVITTDIKGIKNNAFRKYGLIGIGSLDGVQEGQIVTNDTGIIGRITTVSSNTAQILLTYDSNFRIPVKTLSGTSEAIITGINEKNKLKIIYANDDHNFVDGDYVITAGNLPNVPTGIFIGQFKSPHFVITNTNWNQLNMVSIVTNDNK